MDKVTFFTAAHNQAAFFPEKDLEKDSQILGIAAKRSGPTVLIGRDIGGGWEGRILIAEMSYSLSLLMEDRLFSALKKSGHHLYSGDALTESNCSAIGPGGDYGAQGQRLIKFVSFDDKLP
jgi:hypothetical protein